MPRPMSMKLLINTCWALGKDSQYCSRQEKHKVLKPVGLQAHAAASICDAARTLYIRVGSNLLTTLYEYVSQVIDIIGKCKTLIRKWDFDCSKGISTFG